MQMRIQVQGLYRPTHWQRKLDCSHICGYIIGIVITITIGMSEMNDYCLRLSDIAGIEELASTHFEVSPNSRPALLTVFTGNVRSPDNKLDNLQLQLTNQMDCCVFILTENVRGQECSTLYRWMTINSLLSLTVSYFSACA